MVYSAVVVVVDMVEVESAIGAVPSIVEVESLLIMGAVSVVVVSVVVVVSAGFDSHEARPAANTIARADTFSRFFIFGVGLIFRLKTLLIPASKKSNPS